MYLTRVLSPIHVEPTCVSQTLKIPEWRRAMSEEFDALVFYGTLDLVPSSALNNVVGCLDYIDTFSLVVKSTTIRVVLSIAVSCGWSLRQLDVNNAFLQGHLSETVFMVQPLGFADSTYPSHVCRLKKVIYGLKQVPRAWYNELRQFLLHNSNGDLVDKFITTLARRFLIKDLGTLSYFLGAEVLPCSAGLYLSQQKYVLDLLSRTKMFDAKPVSTPLLADHDLKLLMAPPLQMSLSFVK
ncbi:hypothetical protein LWI28_026380 [Acer negundo]|uniref:Reverse transcriptase Ty1/copia-type domain-containing protein n=1 Tax=Acer negundo TaxID=4023 RepID=A0AAD5J6X9_ACENE|nr:hypothetical protein LWI28_026380 [Acer negundo]